MTLPPGWTQAMFDVWFAPIYAGAVATRDSYVLLRSPPDLQANSREYLATGVTTSALPLAWSMKEFTDWIGGLIAEVPAVFYSEMLSQTPPELQAAVLEQLAASGVRLTEDGVVRLTEDGVVRMTF